jgi:LysM repeat protein
MAAARRRRSPARWLAPVAVAACAVAVYGVVHSTLKDNGSSSGGGSHQSTTTAPASGSSRKKTHHHTYRVKAGDTLSEISIKTGVSLATIERLNPKLDAQSLHTGQKIKLAP